MNTTFNKQRYLHIEEHSLTMNGEEQRNYCFVI